MDVMNVEQAKIAEEAGASAVMALGECEAEASVLLHRMCTTRLRVGTERMTDLQRGSQRISDVMEVSHEWYVLDLAQTRNHPSTIHPSFYITDARHGAGCIPTA
jgi:hypothetical protein